jgi:hypothetical protein
MTTTQEDQDVEIVALMYYLYRQSGAALGDDLAGFCAWKKINIEKPWVVLAKKEADAAR